MPNPEALATLIRERGPRLVGLARRILRDQEAEAADAVQDAYISALRSLDEFRGDASLATWLHRIVVNAALMRRRATRLRRETPLESPEWTADDAPPDLLSRAAPAQSLDEALERKQLRACIRACVEQLPPTYRAVVLLREVRELDTRETAAALGISPNAVKVRLYRARQALEPILRARGVVAPEPPRAAVIPSEAA